MMDKLITNAKPDRIDWKKSYWAEAEKCGLLEQQLAELKAESERLAAHNAMLVEAARVAINDHEFFSPHPLCKAINATSESIQQWLDKRDAEVRRNALLKAADWFESAPEVNAFRIRDTLRRMADEVK